MVENRKQLRERGQSLIFVAFGIFTLMAFVGLGVDLGLAYVERVNAQRAADAAALAAAADLPLEAAAQARALEYLSENGYDCGLNPAGGMNALCTNGDVRVEVKTGAGEDGYGRYSGPDDAEGADLVIRLNTYDYRDSGKGDSSSKIRIEVVKKVGIYFMRLFGFDNLTVRGIATAENIQNLDILLVFDRSGSMEYDTLCHGCWTPVNGVEYRNGSIWPLPWGSSPTNASHCSGSGGPLVSSGYTYYIIEAEEYSAISNDYHRATNPGIGYTFWVIGRNGSVNEPNTGYLGDLGAYGRDSRGAYLSHAPRRAFTGGGSGAPCTWSDLNNGSFCSRASWVTEHGGPYPAPRADYDFTVSTTKQWYFWIRAQGGDSNGKEIFWGLTSSDNVYKGTPIGVSTGNPSKGYSYNSGSTKYANGGTNNWLMGRLGTGTTNAAPYERSLVKGVNYTLHLWAGAAGFAVDRIVITDNPATTIPSAADKLNSAYIDNSRTRAACDPCDPRFGGYPGGTGNPPNCNDPNLPSHARDRRMDDLFDDEQPLASASASAVRFVRRLDYRLDQVGLVTYSGNADPAVELRCLKSNGAGCTKNVIDNTINNVLLGRNQTFASGGTNIPDALEAAIESLDYNPPHYGRPGAARIIILMTDGVPNAYDGLSKENELCYKTDYWPQPPAIEDTADSRAASDCTIYFANLARDKGIVLYTISLGEAVDVPLMDGAAERTGGLHLHAERPEELDNIFEEIYNRIFLRLVR